MSDALIQIVDENDKPVGAASIEDSHKQGLCHRISRVMVEDPSGKILLQKRVADKGLYPGRWDNSAAGHVDEGEDYLTAARRELYEEIGLKDVELREILYYRHNGQFEWRRLHRFTKVYLAVVPKDTQFMLQADEVSEVKWFTPAAFKELVISRPNQITDGVQDVFERYYQ